MEDNVIKIPAKPSQELKLLGQCIAYTVASKTEWGRHHIVLIQISEGLSSEPMPEPKAICSCRGFQQARSEAGCWHVQDVWAQLERDSNAAGI